jgi:Uma2 family endonuclease
MNVAKASRYERRAVARMNIAVTKAADSLRRRAFSVDDISRMMEAGILGEDENFELIEGDLVMMAAKHVGHDKIKFVLNRAFNRVAPDELFVAIEPSLQLAKDVLVEPDIALIRQSVYDAQLKTFARPMSEDVRLVIEIAGSSLSYDRGIKARIYARHRIPEFWVIDAAERKTFVYTGPSGDTWSSIVERGPMDPLMTSALHGFSIRLGDIA